MIPFQSPTDVTPFSRIVYQYGLTKPGRKESGYDNVLGFSNVRCLWTRLKTLAESELLLKPFVDVDNNN